MTLCSRRLGASYWGGGCKIVNNQSPAFRMTRKGSLTSGPRLEVLVWMLFDLLYFALFCLDLIRLGLGDEWSEGE